MLRTTLSQTGIKSVQQSARVLLTSKQDAQQINQQSVRYARGIKPWNNGDMDDWRKHIYNYDYRRARGRKVLKIDLPDFNKDRKESENMRMSPEEIRSMLKKKGLVLQRKWIEKPIYVGDSSRIIDEYVPPEGDGKASIISTKGVTQQVTGVTGRGKEMWHLRKIRKYIESFDPTDFGHNEALKVYIAAHEALANHDLNALSNVVTDTCLPKMLFSAELKTIKWKYVKSLEAPYVVNVKVTEQEGYAFGQVTVRFHSQQLLAVYDRFGRLVHGSEAILKDVLEYIVFENRISSLYGVWRLHGKIVPEWIKRNEPGMTTTVLPPKQETPPAATTPAVQADAKASSSPAAATA